MHAATRISALLALGLTVMGATQAVSAYDRRVRIINDTSQTMTMFHASNVNTTDWQEDILGNDVVRPGGSVMVNINDGTGHCRYDLRATFADGERVVRRNFNVCDKSSWRVYE